MDRYDWEYVFRHLSLMYMKSYVDFYSVLQWEIAFLFCFAFMNTFSGLLTDYGEQAAVGTLAFSILCVLALGNGAYVVSIFGCLVVVCHTSLDMPKLIDFLMGSIIRIYTAILLAIGFLPRLLASILKSMNLSYLFQFLAFVACSIVSAYICIAIVLILKRLVGKYITGEVDREQEELNEEWEE